MERYEINIKIKSCPICSCAMHTLGDSEVMRWIAQDAEEEQKS